MIPYHPIARVLLSVLPMIPSCCRLKIGRWVWVWLTSELVGEIPIWIFQCYFWIKWFWFLWICDIEWFAYWLFIDIFHTHNTILNEKSVLVVYGCSVSGSFNGEIWIDSNKKCCVMIRKSLYCLISFLFFTKSLKINILKWLFEVIMYISWFLLFCSASLYAFELNLASVEPLLFWVDELSEACLYINWKWFGVISLSLPTIYINWLRNGLIRLIMIDC